MAVRVGAIARSRRLAAALAFTSQAARASNHAVPGQAVLPPHVKTLSLPGAFDLTFLPRHGQQVNRHLDRAHPRSKRSLQ